MRRARLLPALCALLACTEAAGRASPPALQPALFRQYLARGERPEIVACMVAATRQVRSDPRWRALRWDAAVSASGHVQDSEVDGQVLRVVTLAADGRQATDGSWQPLRVQCRQPDNGPVQVQLQPRTPAERP